MAASTQQPLPRAEGFERWNFQREETLEELERLLAADGPAPKVVALRAAPGSGRRYTLGALLARRAEPFALATLDMEGFEPGLGRPGAFAEHLRRRAGLPAEGPRAKALLALAERLAPSVFGAGALLLALAATSHADASAPGILEAPLPDPEAADEQRVFELLCARHLERGPLLVHVPRPAIFPIVLWHALVRAARREPRVLLAVSAEEDRQVELPFVADPEVLDLRPLLPGEVGTLLRRSFPAAKLPAEFGVALGRASAGNPAELAHKLCALERAGALVAAGTELALTRPLEDPEVARIVASDVLTALEERLQGNADAPFLRSLLALGALAGENVPIVPLCEALNADKDLRERAVDFFDDELLEDGLDLFEDLEYRHPSFLPFSTPVYRFRSSRVRAAVIARFARGMPPETPRKLLEFLVRRMPAMTLGAAAVHLELVQGIGDERLAQSFRQHLSWWTARRESLALSAALGELVDEKKLARESLFEIAGKAEAWPPHRRLALLDAYRGGEQASTGDAAGEVHLLRAELLDLDLDHAAALEESGRALELLALPRKPSAERVAGSALLGLGRAPEAARTLDAAVAALRAAAEAGARERRLELAAATRALGEARAACGDAAGARDALRQARADFDAAGRPEALLKADHGGLSRLEAEIEARAGRHEEAERLARQALGEYQQAVASGRVGARELAQAFLSRGGALLALNRPAEAVAPFEQAFLLGRQGDAQGRADFDLVGRALFGAAQALRRLGKLKEAAQAAGGAAENLLRGDRIGRVDWSLFARSAGALAHTLHRARAHADAQRVLAQCLEHVERAAAAVGGAPRDLPLAHARILRRRALTEARLGDRLRAAETCARARKLADPPRS